MLFLFETAPFGLNRFSAKEYHTSKLLGRVWCSELTKQKLNSKYLTPDNRNLIFGVAFCVTFFTFISTEALSTTVYWFSQFQLNIRGPKVFHQIQLKFNTKFVSTNTVANISSFFLGKLNKVMKRPRV